MSKPSKNKLKKKKLHEKEAKQKVLVRREEIRRKANENAKFDKEEKDTRHRQVPIRNEDYYKAAEWAKEEIMMQIKQNEEFLQELQKEYAEENPGQSLLEVVEKKLSENEIIKNLNY